jgi:hypothetical protein
MTSLAEFKLPVAAYDAIGACRDRDDFIRVAKALVQNERNRCIKICQDSRESGETDLRGIIAGIRYGGDEPQQA